MKKLTGTEQWVYRAYQVDGICGLSDDIPEPPYIRDEDEAMSDVPPYGMGAEDEAVEEPWDAQIDRRVAEYEEEYEELCIGAEQFIRGTCGFRRAVKDALLRYLQLEPQLFDEDTRKKRWRRVIESHLEE